MTRLALVRFLRLGPLKIYNTKHALARLVEVAIVALREANFRPYPAHPRALLCVARPPMSGRPRQTVYLRGRGAPFRSSRRGLQPEQALLPGHVRRGPTHQILGPAEPERAGEDHPRPRPLVTKFALRFIIGIDGMSKIISVEHGVV